VLGRGTGGPTLVDFTAAGAFVLMAYLLSTLSRPLMRL
jgi:hypothetical protein